MQVLSWIIRAIKLVHEGAQVYLLRWDKSIGKPDSKVKQHIRCYCFHGFSWTLCRIDHHCGFNWAPAQTSKRSIGFLVFYTFRLRLVVFLKDVLSWNTNSCIKCWCKQMQIDVDLADSSVLLEFRTDLNEWTPGIESYGRYKNQRVNVSFLY